MTSWQQFEQQAPQLAAFGRTRFGRGVAYLGTLRADGSPRVHPVTPIIGEHLYLFMEPTSPKGKDLLRDPRYTLHCAVENMSGGEGEFYVRGLASPVDDPQERELAVQASPYSPQARYILFRFSVEFAFMNVYNPEGAQTSTWQPSV